LGRFEPTIKDHVLEPEEPVGDAHPENITLRKGLSGAKPPGFCRWVFRFLGLQPWDNLADLYPGTGAVSVAWAEWKSEARRASHV
jgi:hypothetical protein